MIGLFDATPCGPFIDSRRIEHDGSREVIAAGSLIDGIWRSARPGRSDTVAAAIFRGRMGRMARERAEAAGIARVAAAGREAWDAHEAARETGS